MTFKIFNFKLPFDIQWDKISEALKTENIIKQVSSVDPVIVFSNPYYLVPALILCAVLFFMKFYRTLALIVGCAVFWYAFVHFLPKEGELKLNEIAQFGTTCVAVLGMWIYVFFIRED